MSFAEYDDDKDVGEESDGQDDRHDVAVDGHGQGGRTVPCRAVDVVTVTFVPTTAERMNLKQEGRKKMAS